MELSILNYPKFIVVKDDEPIGVISFENKGEGQYYIGCLCIIPKYQGMGIGTQVFKYMLSICIDWKRITLITPADKEENIKFYTKKCGFKIGSTIMDGNVEVVEFYMER